MEALLTGLAIGWLIAKFEPLHWFIDYIFMIYIPNTKFTEYIHSAFGCWKCMSFWITLLASGNIVYAATVSMVAYLITEWTQD